MKAAFFHSHKLRKCGEEYFSTGGLSYNTLKKYFELADQLLVSTRAINIEKNDIVKYKKTSGENVSIIPIENYNNFIDIIKNRKSIKKQVKDIINNVDIVIVREPSELASIAYEEAVRQKKHILVEMVGCVWDSLSNYNLLGKILAPYFFIRTKRIIKNARSVIYVTNDFLQKRYPTLGESVGCSDVELQEINEEILEKRIKRIKEEKENHKIILGTLGAIDVKYKGQEYVIRAISKLKKEGYNYEYQLVGGGKKEKLEKLATKLGVKENVKFLGPKSHDEVFYWLDNIDIYIQSSKTEGLPRALIEAMSRACPCIGSNAGGIPELLQKNCIFKKGKYRDLITLLKNFNMELRIEQAKMNFKKSKEYSKEYLDKRRLEFYSKILSKEL